MADAGTAEDFFGAASASPSATAPTATSGSAEDFFGDKATPAVAGDKAFPRTVGYQVETEARRSFKDKTKQAMDIFKGSDPTVDYDTGAPFNIRVALSRSDNPNEAAAALEREVGTGNYGQDRSGTWWVRQNGKKVAVRPRGFINLNPVADIAAAAPVTTGAIGGAEIGAEIGAAGGPVGVGLGGVLGAATGSMLGSAVGEQAKSLEGTYRKTPAQELHKEVGEGVLGSGIQAGQGALVGLGKQYLAPAVRKFLGVTPDIQKRIASTLEQGGLPPLITAAPSWKTGQYVQKMWRLLSHDPHEELNRDVVKNMTTDVIRDMFPDEASVTKALNEVYGVEARLSPKAIGEALGAKAGERLATQKADADVALKGAQDALQPALDKIHTYAQANNPALSEELATTIQQARSDLGERFSSAYDAVDRMAGDERIIPIERISQAAKFAMRDMPAGEVSDALKSLADADPNTRLTFGEAHRLRNWLNEAARRGLKTLTPNIRTHNILNRIEGVQAGMEEAADFSELMDFSGIAKDYGLNPEVLTALKDTDAAYAKEIAIFKNANVNRIVQDAKNQRFADPETISKSIMEPGYTRQAQEIMKILPQDQRNEVARVYARSLISSVSDPDGNITGAALRDVLAKPEQMRMMDAMYPPEFLRTIRGMADQLAALDGKIDVKDIGHFTGPNVASALTRAIQSQAALKQFTANDILKGLASQNPKAMDRATDALLGGGKGIEMGAVMNALGADSTQWKMVQQYALKKLFRSAVDEASTGEGRVRGEALRKSLGNFTPEEQNMLFPDNLRESLIHLSKDVEFLFPSDLSDTGASIAAAEIKGHLPFKARAVGHWIRYAIENALVSRPELLQFLAGVRVYDPSMGDRLARVVVRNLTKGFMFSQNTGPGEGAPSEAQ